jgi:hypothetical protein
MAHPLTEKGFKGYLFSLRQEVPLNDKFYVIEKMTRLIEQKKPEPPTNLLQN